MMYMKIKQLFLIILLITGSIEAVLFSRIPAAHAAVYFMNGSGQSIGALDVSSGGANAGKIVVKSNGKEIVLGGGGSCGALCALLTASVDDGNALIVPAVPDIDFGSSGARLKNFFVSTMNVNELGFSMAGEFGSAVVGKVLGIVSVDGGVAKVGLLDAAGKDDRVDTLVTDMEQAKIDIANLKLQLAAVQTALDMKIKEEVGSCRSEMVPTAVVKAVGSGDWVVGQ